MLHRIDRSLLLVLMFLIGLGIVQVYSSSFIFAIEAHQDGHYFFRKQLLFAVLGFLVMVATTYLPMSWVRRYGFVVWLLAAVFIALTLLPSFSVKAGGAQRWLRMPLGLRFEPGELLKVSFPLLLAAFLASPFRWIKELPTWVKVAVGLAPLILLLKQPDFGTFAICLFVVFATLFVFGLKWRYVFGSFALAVPAFLYLIINYPYRYNRIVAFLDPWADPAEKGFQIIQSLLSFYSGGLFGVGLGQGQGKLFFLPEAHTDFTLAVLAEEMGFVGVMVVISLYGFVVYRGLQISLRAEPLFDRALSMGVTLWFGISVFINVGVVLGLLPTKGLTLPFLSYGGSSLVTTCFAMGLLLNIDRATRLKLAK